MKAHDINGVPNYNPDSHTANVFIGSNKEAFKLALAVEGFTVNTPDPKKSIDTKPTDPSASQASGTVNNIPAIDPEEIIHLKANVDVLNALKNSKLGVLKSFDEYVSAGASDEAAKNKFNAAIDNYTQQMEKSSPNLITGHEAEEITKQLTTELDTKADNLKKLSDEAYKAHDAGGIGEYFTQSNQKSGTNLLNLRTAAMNANTAITKETISIIQKDTASLSGVAAPATMSNKSAGQNK